MKKNRITHQQLHCILIQCIYSNVNCFLQNFFNKNSHKRITIVCKLKISGHAKLKKKQNSLTITNKTVLNNSDYGNAVGFSFLANFVSKIQLSVE